MVQSAAPKNDAKPSVKDEQQPQDEKNAAPAPAEKGKGETGRKDMVEAKPSPIKSAKDAADTKPSTDKPAAETNDAPADPALVAVELPQPQVPPLPQPQMMAAVAPDTGHAGGEDDLTTAPAAAAPAAAVPAAAAPAAAAPAAAAPQADMDAPAAPLAEARATSPAEAPVTADAPPAPPAAAQPAADTATAPVPAQPQTVNASSQDAATAEQAAIPTAPQPEAAPAQASPSQPAEIQAATVAAPKPATAPDAEAAKPGARKAQPQAGKDVGKDKSDETQPSLARRDTQAFDIAFAAAPKPQPQAQVSPDTGMAVHGLSSAAAQTASTPAPLPQLLQQAQVTAEPPKPNMPSLAVEIAARTQSGARQFDIRLDPPELGRVEVRLSIDATGKASAHLSADQPQTLDLLQKDAPLLARALRDAGLDVAQDGLNFSLRQQAQNQGQNGGAPRGLGRGQRLHAVAGIETAPAAISFRANGRLDIRV